MTHQCARHQSNHWTTSIGHGGHACKSCASSGPPPPTLRRNFPAMDVRWPRGRRVSSASWRPVQWPAAHNDGVACSCFCAAASVLKSETMPTSGARMVACIQRMLSGGCPPRLELPASQSHEVSQNVCKCQGKRYALADKVLSMCHVAKAAWHTSSMKPASLVSIARLHAAVEGAAGLAARGLRSVRRLIRLDSRVSCSVSVVLPTSVVSERQRSLADCLHVPPRRCQPVQVVIA